jgi:ATP-binding cassette, subfamily C, bacterial CydD
MLAQRRILALATGVRPWIAASVVMRLAVMATYLGQALLMATILSQLLHGAGVSEQWGRLILLAVFVLLRMALLWASEIVAQSTAAMTKEKLRAALFAKIGELGPAYTGGTRTGEIQHALVEGVEALESYFGSYLPALISAIVTPAAAVIILALRDPELALVVALFVVAAVVVPPLWSRPLATMSRNRRAAFLAMSAEFLDTLQGMVTLKAFGASASRRRSLAVRSDELCTRMVKEMAVVLVRGSIFAVVVLGGLAVTTAIAAVRVAHGDLAVGTLFVALFLAREALRPVGELAAAFHASYAANVAAEQIERLFAAQPPAPEQPNVVPLAIARPSVEFAEVSFAYSADDGPVLRNFNLCVEPGERIAIVGPSGAGKTTIVSLLLRFVDPQSGCIRIGGHDVSVLPLEQLRSMIALVSQDTYLFGGTVRENLAMARPEASDAEIEAAARIANVHDDICALPYGYATRIGERGLRLSGGQRQRLAIARAVLKDAPILVLDEATANVDAAAEATIQTALDQLTLHRTTIVIAHRLSTVRNADRIVVLQDGRIVETGRHDDLLVQAGTYARLVSAQAVG